LPELKTIKADYNQYRLLVKDEHLNFPGSVFYHPDFLAIAADVLNLEYEPLIIYRGDDIIGLANILKGGRFGVKGLLIPSLFQYFGPVIFSDDKDAFRTIIKAIEQDIDLAVFCLPPEQIDLEEFGDWKKIPRLTYYLSPESFENMKNNCSSNVKNKLNKAIKANVEIRNVTEFPYQLYQASFKRQGLNPPVGQSQMIAWVEQLMSQKLAFTFVALVDEKPVAVRTVLLYGKYAYAWVTGSLPEYNHLGITHLLLLKTGEFLYNRGAINWDLLGGDIKSIGDFKRSFGSVPQTHFQYEKNFTFKGTLYRNLMKIKAYWRG
jgi:hypothetical protein